jgi:hypothetical protein
VPIGGHGDHSYPGVPMTRVNEQEVFLQRARECEALAETSTESHAKEILLQMAEGYWIMLSAVNSHSDAFQAQKKPSNS